MTPTPTPERADGTEYPTPVPVRAARKAPVSAPAGRAAPVPPVAGAAPKTSPRRGERPAAGTNPGPGEADPAAGDRLPASPGLGRAQAPAGGAVDADAAPLAGLQGAEWRQAVKAAQAKGRRRKTTRPAADGKRPPPARPEPGPAAPSAAFTATARCLRGCDWTTGPGTPAEVDRDAEKHTTRPPKHPTITCAELVGAA